MKILKLFPLLFVMLFAIPALSDVGDKETIVENNADLRDTMKTKPDILIKAIAGAISENKLDKANEGISKLDDYIKQLEDSMADGLAGWLKQSANDKDKLQAGLDAIVLVSTKVSFEHALDNFKDTKIVDKELRYVMSEIMAYESRLGKLEKGFEACQKIKGILRETNSQKENEKKFREKCAEAKKILSGALVNATLLSSQFALAKSIKSPAKRRRLLELVKDDINALAETLGEDKISAARKCFTEAEKNAGEEHFGGNAQAASNELQKLYQ